MGYYIQGPAKGKAGMLIKEHGARVLSALEDVEKIINEGKEGIVAVVDNGSFEAAGFCYNADEFKAFCDPTDPRPITFLAMDRKKAEELSEFRRREY